MALFTSERDKRVGLGVVPNRYQDDTTRDEVFEFQKQILLIQDLFKTNRLFIHASCKNLIYELESYSYKDQESKETKDENPIKENDHLLDALSYVIRSYENNKLSIQKPSQHIPNFYRYGGVKKY